MLMAIVDPTTQADFDDQVVDNITDIDPGHQCYKLDPLENIVAGTNATIQLEYWADYEGENDGRNQSFFACADIVSDPTHTIVLMLTYNFFPRHLSRPQSSRNKFPAST
jgi:hypothetical protein